MAKIEYTPLNLPKALVEELKIWRLASIPWRIPIRA